MYSLYAVHSSDAECGDDLMMHGNISAQHSDRNASYIFYTVRGANDL